MWLIWRNKNKGSQMKQVLIILAAALALFFILGVNAGKQELPAIKEALAKRNPAYANYQVSIIARPKSGGETQQCGSIIVKDAGSEPTAKFFVAVVSGISPSVTSLHVDDSLEDDFGSIWQAFCSEAVSAVR
jgi:hypothetical protein